MHSTAQNFYIPPAKHSEGEIFSLKYRLPKDFSCKRCVIQWRYVMASHLWPCLHNGTLSPDCGPQLEARACADVRILPVMEVPVKVVPVEEDEE